MKYVLVVMLIIGGVTLERGALGFQGPGVALAAVGSYLVGRWWPDKKKET